MLYLLLSSVLAAFVMAKPSHIPTVEIWPGVHMPLVGAGSWLYNDTTVYESYCKAFEAGYTYIDTAWGYRNEEGVGKAIRDCWLAKGRKREDLFVMTKIPGGLNYSEAIQAHDDNLKWLGLDTVEHVMTHFPCDWEETPERCNPERRKEHWKALETIYNQGKARSIGVSHYCKQHIDDILSIATVRPSINQVEWHVGSGDIDDTIEYSRANGIFFQSFSPLCGPCEYEPQDSLINGDLVTSIGKKYGKSGSQVSLKYLVQHAQTMDHYAGVIPKSNSLAHLKSNLDIFDFTLSDEDMAALGAATKPEGTGGDCDAN